MTRYLLDTDTCIYLIKRQPPRALAKLQSLEITSVGISSALRCALVTHNEREFCRVSDLAVENWGS